MKPALAFRLRRFDELSSTNDEVKRALRSGEPEGLVVVASRQATGYGRQGRVWESPFGGLYSSWLLRPDVAIESLSTLSLVAALAVRRTIIGFFPDEDADDVQIKWPNDVVCADGKLAGISLEALGGGVCVGIGINVVAPVPRRAVAGKHVPVYVADRCSELGDGETAVTRVLDALMFHWSEVYAQWCEEGFSAFAKEYERYASLTGKHVQVVDRQGTALVEGRATRVDECGRLIVVDAAGRETAVSSGEAHLL